MKTIRLRYFALLREQRGLSEENIRTELATVRDLYDELRQRHGFTLPGERLRVAVDGEFAPWHTPLRDGAELVFIPPVAGG